MRVDSMLLTLTLLLTTVCWGHVISKGRTSTPLLSNLNEITRHLRSLTSAMGEFDRELREALSVEADNGRDIKRSAEQDEDSISCRLSLNEYICRTQEIMKDRFSPKLPILHDPSMPGKRSRENSAAKYQKIASDLKKKRQLLRKLRNVFNNAGHILEREKKWFTCNLNLGFTCQTQEYSAIADYYDFLNSPESPGKKRSVPSRSQHS